MSSTVVGRSIRTFRPESSLTHCVLGYHGRFYDGVVPFPSAGPRPAEFLITGVTAVLTKNAEM